MSLALFCRDVENIEELKSLTDINKGVLAEYKIIGKVRLSTIEYEIFCKGLTKGYGFLSQYVEFSKVSNDTWNCVLVKGDDEQGVLIMTNGYQYPRFVALYQKE